MPEMDDTVGCANVIAVNSNFTAKVFKESFTVLGHRVKPVVLYPAIDLSVFQDSASTALDYLPGTFSPPFLTFLDR